MTAKPTTRALLMMTSHAELGRTGRPTGAYLPEVAHPWKVLTDAGIEVDLASVRGGRPPITGVDSGDPIQQSFLTDPVMSDALNNTVAAAEVDASEYDLVFYAGGHGTMWDFADDEQLARIGRSVYESGGVVAAVCHGPAALVGLALSDGSPLVEGKRIAAFTDDEERAVELHDVVPFSLAQRLVDHGAVHIPAPRFTENVVTDGRLVTGQNPASAAGVAAAAIAAVVPVQPT